MDGKGGPRQRSTQRVHSSLVGRSEQFSQVQEVSLTWRLCCQARGRWTADGPRRREICANLPCLSDVTEAMSVRNSLLIAQSHSIQTGAQLHTHTATNATNKNISIYSSSCMYIYMCIMSIWHNWFTRRIVWSIRLCGCRWALISASARSCGRYDTKCGNHLMQRFNWLLFIPLILLFTFRSIFFVVFSFLCTLGSFCIKVVGGHWRQTRLVHEWIVWDSSLCCSIHFGVNAIAVLNKCEVFVFLVGVWVLDYSSAFIWRGKVT